MHPVCRASEVRLSGTEARKLLAPLLGRCNTSFYLIHGQDIQLIPNLHSLLSSTHFYPLSSALNHPFPLLVRFCL